MPSPRKRNRPPPATGKIERHYGRQLRKIARHIGDIINAFEPGEPSSDVAIRHALSNYSDMLTDWARHTATRMLDMVNKTDEQAWRDRSVEMSVWMRDEVLNAPTGATMRALLDEQVSLIKSIPLGAAQRVHEWTLVGLEDSTRAREVAAAIKDSNNVTAARAMLIARTEVARTASMLTESRARHIGSEGYIWRTSQDSDVRDSHKQMNGKYVRWDSPPKFDDGGGSYHAGCIWNCRCFSDVVLPD